MDLGCWRFGFVAEIERSYTFEFFVAQVCSDLIKAFHDTNSQCCVCVYIYIYIYGLLIPVFSSLGEIILGLCSISSVPYLDINIFKIFSVDYGLDLSLLSYMWLEASQRSLLPYFLGLHV